MTYETLARKLDQCLAAQVKLQKERDLLFHELENTLELYGVALDGLDNLSSESKCDRRGVERARFLLLQMQE